MKNDFLLKVSLLFCILIIHGCKESNQVEEAITKIPIEIKVERFDRLFANAEQSDLSKLKEKYPFLFPQKYHDSIWYNKIKDTIQIEINEEVVKAFPYFDSEMKELEYLLKHIKYYFPEVTEPRVITMTSDVDYHRKVILSDNLLLIALDTYLGADHRFYGGIQEYLKRNFEKEQMIPDIATIYAKQLVELPRDRTFLSNLLYYGKELYLKKLFLPSYNGAQLMGYKKEQFDWVEANEEEIWKYFIEKQLLYSTQGDLLPRFLYPGPFSKFYLEEIDKEAPDRVGQYIGWRIVDAYMKNNNVSLRQLLMTDATTIFNASRYKPKR